MYVEDPIGRTGDRGQGTEQGGAWTQIDLGFCGGEVAAVEGDRLGVVVVARGRTGGRHKTLWKHDRESLAGAAAGAGLEVLDDDLLPLGLLCRRRCFLGRRRLFLRVEEGSAAVDVPHSVSFCRSGRRVLVR